MARRTRQVVGRLLAAILMTGITQSIASAEDGKLVPKYTAVKLTSLLKDDKAMTLAVKLEGQTIEVEGEVAESSGRLLDDGAWVIRLQGCELKPGVQTSAGTRFLAISPDRPKAQTLEVGDAVTIRGEFRPTSGANVSIGDPRIVKVVRAKPVADHPPARVATAEEFVKESVANPEATLAKYKGKRIALTGQVSTANPTYSSFGISLAAGRLKPDEPSSGVFATCAIPDSRLDASWLLASGQKVKVVGILKAVAKSDIELIQCQITELEPNPLRTVTPAELAKAFAGNEADAVKKYGSGMDRKEFLMEVVVPAAKDASNPKAIIFNDAGGTPVKIQFEQRDVKRLKAGDKIFVKAECYGLQTGDKTVLLFAWVLAKPEAKK